MSTRLNVLGVGISAINMNQALAQLDAWVAAKERQYVCICNVHSVMECRRSPDVRHVFNQAGMVTPDGMPLVFLLRQSGYRQVSRVYGPDLMLASMERSRQTGQRHYFHGGVAGVAAELAAVMERRVAGLTVVDAGAPIPCRLIVGELSRLDCGFSFLRRSYHADIRSRDPVAEIPRLLAALAAASRRDADDVRKDREALIAAVEQWTGVLTSV